MPLDPSPEPVWIIGSVTWDEVDGVRWPGGTALYAARTCDALDVSAFVLFAGDANLDLTPLEGHETTRVPTEQSLILRHDFTSGQRQQSLLAATEHTLILADVPEGWPEPTTLILGPLLPDEADIVAFIDEFPAAQVALLAQGLQRAIVPGGQIAHRAQPASVLMDAARPHVSIFLSEEEVRLWPAGAIQHLAARAARVVVTRGQEGATVYDRRGSHEIAPFPASPVDTTGAGDVFAAALILTVQAGEEFAERLAAACSAAAVEVRGPGVLPPLPEILQRAALPADRHTDEGSTA